ncbi:MAG: radical SAM protein [Rhizomicrobium sp.]
MDQYIRENLGVILKVSERCNLVCDYCYFFFHGDETHRDHPPIIRPALVDDLCAFIRSAASEHGVRTVRIGLHGGEPLLLKKARFREVCSKLKGLEDEGLRIELVVQTNGTLIDADWIDIFAQFDIHLGVSFDGPQAENDRHRFKKNGKGSYADARRGWELLQAAHADRRIALPGLLCVIDPEQDGRAVYRHFVDELKSRSMGFIFPDYTWDTVPAGNHVEKLERYLAAVFEEWTRDGDFKIRVRHIRSMLGALLLDSAASFQHRFADDVRNLITVSSNGALGPEDVIRTISPRFREAGYRLPQHSLTDLTSGPIWTELEKARTDPAEKCRQCEWWGMCGGGRPWNRFSEANGFRNPSVYCSALRRLYSDAAEYLVANGLPRSEMLRRRDQGRFVDQEKTGADAC